MSENGTVPPGRPWPILLPGQAAVFGLAVFLLDRAASGVVAERAAVTVRVTEDARAELVRYGESVVVGGATSFLLIATILLVPVAVLLRCGSRRAAAAGLVTMGLLTPPYLAGLAVVAFTTDPVSGIQAGFMSSQTADLLRSWLPGWYAPARTALPGAAVMAWLTSVFLLSRSAAVRWRAVPAPRAVPLLLGHLPLIGVLVTVFGSVAIGQTERLAHQEARAAAGEYAGAGLFYLEHATGTVWRYAVLLAVAGALALMLAAVVHRTGIRAPLLVVHGMAGVPLLLLLLVVSFATPFAVSGAADEPVPPVLGSGPEWYFPALLTQTFLGAFAYVTATVLLIRGDRAAQG
ncbi:hypothetical protein ACFQVD_30810 [Streptosporangium amethystogenes subsp. fukuiense]|uniref:Integral membrane protein n=1 Tax=Streptosporangium amethystogenes subsp. fukuiense TaxID=698418 RepID=A0ABW2T9U7_9ACTN